MRGDRGDRKDGRYQDFVPSWPAVGFTDSFPVRSCDPRSFLKASSRASLVAQWLRICLPMQGTRVRALVWEDPTCHGATRPVSHNY